MFLDTSIYCVPDTYQPLVFTLCQKLNHVTPNPQIKTQDIVEIPAWIHKRIMRK